MSNPGRDRLSWYQSLAVGHWDLGTLSWQTLGRQDARGVIYHESRSSTRDRTAPREMPKQAEPSARPEASAPPDLREQLAALTEVIKQQGVLLQRMCETITQCLITNIPYAPWRSPKLRPVEEKVGKPSSSSL
uniref:Uncharacterized protein n=1 Tax=Ananas comosus var. bracteatus TaxID=296719 RepID=A0A6V7Q696_ANACO|nr:unnamed protein product [Ananas comosus var. bracteatus]